MYSNASISLRSFTDTSLSNYQSYWLQAGVNSEKRFGCYLSQNCKWGGSALTGNILNAAQYGSQLTGGFRTTTPFFSVTDRDHGFLGVRSGTNTYACNDGLLSNCYAYHDIETPSVLALEFLPRWYTNYSGEKIYAGNGNTDPNYVLGQNINVSLYSPADLGSGPTPGWPGLGTNKYGPFFTNTYGLHGDIVSSLSNYRTFNLASLTGLNYQINGQYSGMINPYGGMNDTYTLNFYGTLMSGENQGGGYELQFPRAGTPLFVQP
jgi:hypothetical protein